MRDYCIGFIFIFIGLGLGLCAVHGSIQRRQPVNNIPERYDGHLDVLLRDYQRGILTTEGVVQILILWADKGMFVPPHDMDVQQDHFYIDKEQHERIRQYRKAIFKK